jgi:hypothetical protein
LPLSFLFFETYTLSFGGSSFFYLDSLTLGLSFGFKSLTLDLG